MNWITIQKLSELSGYTVPALRMKMERGVFIEGVHYKRAPDGRIHFNIKAYEAWVNGEKPELRHVA